MRKTELCQRTDSLNDVNDSVPPIPQWFQNGFHRFLRPYLRRHFHSIAVNRQTRYDRSVSAEVPLIVYGNHPSWWDPLVAHYLNRHLFPDRQFYAPIDADALAQYQVFAKLGFYGVKYDSIRGAGNFLKLSLAIAQQTGTVIWITPEGRFADARDHSSPLMPGLAHLCSKLTDGWVLPLVLEYSFWEERLPECLCAMGAPFRIAEHSDFSKADWDGILTTRLRETQTSLSQLVMARSSEPFENLLRGKAGAGGFYDTFRRSAAWLRGDRFRAAHGDHFE